MEYNPDIDSPVGCTLEEAILQNDEMKTIWKDWLHIDIDALEVDFTRFDKHLLLHASDQQVSDYFQSFPHGMEGWLLDGINTPDSSISFNHVSSLMEFVAYTMWMQERRLQG